MLESIQRRINSLSEVARNGGEDDRVQIFRIRARQQEQGAPGNVIIP